MMKLNKNSFKSLIIFIIFGAFVLALGPIISSYLIKDILTKDTTATAKQWALYVADTVPGIEFAAKGDKLDPQGLKMLSAKGSPGGVFRAKIFDVKGRLVFVSDDPKYKPNLNGGDSHTPEAVKVLENLQPIVELKKGDNVTRPLHYSEAYVPLIKAGETIGVVEVYVDQTNRYERLKSLLVKFSAVILTIALAAFLLPTFAFISLLKRKQADTAKKLTHVEQHDQLTGTINRSVFRNELDKMLSGTKSIALFFVDLDKFKNINDTLGHDVGDQVLISVANRLAKLITSDGFLGRFGGDEFVLCQPIRRETDSAELANKIVDTLSEPFALGNHDVKIGASVGTANSISEGKNASRLLKAADIAMYHAKQNGRGHAVVYKPELAVAHTKRMNAEALLRIGVKDNKFELHFQPIFHANASDVHGYETLLRIRDENDKLVMPFEFISIAEEMGLMDEIGEIIINEACSFAANLPEEQMIAINLSPAQFASEKIVQFVSDALNKSKLSPDRLVLEVTESALLKEEENVLHQLNLLKELGIKIALDDFGTGYSSLSHLWRYPIDNIKIDRSFVNGLTDHETKSKEIINHIVTLAHNLNADVTAEGIETVEQLEKLKKLGCDYFQGYLLGKPHPQWELAANVSSKLLLKAQDASTNKVSAA